MEPSDLNTHLPPRKRLLAGLRTAASAFDADPPPSPPASADLAARLREMALASSSPDEMIEAARAAAAAAADAAAAARATAAEKASVAVKARAAARAAMEFLDSFSRPGSSRNGLQLKVRSRKKHVQVKLLYKPNGRVEGRDAPPKPRRRRDSDEDVARTPLHRAMNSSPRISPTAPKRPRSTAREIEGDDASNVSSSAHAPAEVGDLPNGGSSGRKSGGTTVPLFKHEVLDDAGEDSSRYATKSGDITDNGAGIGNSSAARKVKIKRKELLLNQNTSEETEPSLQSVVPSESKLNAEKCVNPADAKAPVDGLAPLKITSVWKFKKFKASHCSSDSKVLRNVCSSPSAAETSASVKAD